LCPPLIPRGGRSPIGGLGAGSTWSARGLSISSKGLPRWRGPRLCLIGTSPAWPGRPGCRCAGTFGPAAGRVCGGRTLAGWACRGLGSASGIRQRPSIGGTGGLASGPGCWRTFSRASPGCGRTFPRRPAWRLAPSGCRLPFGIFSWAHGLRLTGSAFATILKVQRDSKGEGFGCGRSAFRLDEPHALGFE